ncbi:MAG: NUDIX hydrolase [Burkholderiaceae bacterium]
MSDVWKPNVTVAAVVTGTGPHAGRYLVVEEETRDGLRINQPAGHLDPNESIVDAAIRETMEETAHPFTPLGLLGVYLSQSMKTKRDEPVEPITYLRFTFVGTVGDPVAGLPLDEGIVRALWMTLDELRACSDRHRSPMVLRCAEDHASGKRPAPLSTLYTDRSALTGVPG